MCELLHPATVNRVEHRAGHIVVGVKCLFVYLFICDLGPWFMCVYEGGTGPSKFESLDRRPQSGPLLPI